MAVTFLFEDHIYTQSDEQLWILLQKILSYSECILLGWFLIDFIINFVNAAK